MFNVFDLIYFKFLAKSSIKACALLESVLASYAVGLPVWKLLPFRLLVQEAEIAFKNSIRYPFFLFGDFFLDFLLLLFELCEDFFPLRQLTFLMFFYSFGVLVFFVATVRVSKWVYPRHIRHAVLLLFIITSYLGITLFYVFFRL